MTPDDVSKGEMPRNLFRRYGKHATTSQGDELAAWRPGHDAAGEAPATELDPALTDLFLAASAPATASELSREGEAVAAFRAAMSAGVSESQSRTTRRPRMIASLTATTAGKLALAALAGGLSLGGASAAAFSSGLPEPLQNIAHKTIGAPAAKSKSEHPKGDDRAHPVPSGSPSALPAAGGAASASPGSDRRGRGPGDDGSPRPCPTQTVKPTTTPTPGAQPAATATATSSPRPGDDNNRGGNGRGRGPGRGDDCGRHNGEDHAPSASPKPTPKPNPSASPDRRGGNGRGGSGGGNGSGSGGNSGNNGSGGGHDDRGGNDDRGSHGGSGNGNGGGNSGGGHDDGPGHDSSDD